MTWRTAVADQDARMESARQRHRRELAEIADDRARAIARAVAEYGRGGRERVADQLGISVGQVDKAIARAKAAGPPSHPPAPQDNFLSILANPPSIVLKGFQS